MKRLLISLLVFTTFISAYFYYLKTNYQLAARKIESLRNIYEQGTNYANTVVNNATYYSE